MLFTSEQVSAGHPDKICDQISDAIVTDCLKDGEGDDGMRLLSDVGLVAAGGLIWNPHNDQPLIQRGKQIQFAEVIPRF